MSLPTITVIGNLKRLELKYVPSGKALCTFQVECSEKNSKGEWINLYLKGECWDKSAEFVNQYFKEGSVALVTGKLVTNVYEKQDGSKVYENKLLFPNVGFVPKDRSESQGHSTGEDYNNNQQQPDHTPPNQNNPQQRIPEIDIDSEDIPFAPIGLQYPYIIHAM